MVASSAGLESVTSGAAPMRLRSPKAVFRGEVKSICRSRYRRSADDYAHVIIRMGGYAPCGAYSQFWRSADSNVKTCPTCDGAVRAAQVMAEEVAPCSE